MKIMKKGVRGKKTEYVDGQGDHSQLHGHNHPILKSSNVGANTILSIDECLVMFLYSPLCIDQRKLAYLQHEFDPSKPAELERLKGWGEMFNLKERGRLSYNKPLSEYGNHFINWLGALKKQNHDLKQDPQKIFQNATSNKSTTSSQHNNIGTTRKRGASVTDLQDLKRSASTDADEPIEWSTIEVLG